VTVRRGWRRSVAFVPTLAGAGVLTVLALLAGAGSAAAVDDPLPEGIGITVTVGPGTASNTAPAPTPPRTTNTTTRTTVNGTTVVTDSQSPPEPTADERSIGGVLYVSGLATAYAPSINPLGGELSAHFTVRNVSTATIDGTARFWVTSPLGTEISAVDPVDVSGLKPGESRVIDATLPGVGQWTFATAHYTYTPPATVDGVPLEPMTRDAFVFLPPWFVLALAVVFGVVYVVVRLVRYVEAPGAAAAPALAETSA
jgi:hypothetical protein